LDARNTSESSLEPTRNYKAYRKSYPTALPSVLQRTNLQNKGLHGAQCVSATISRFVTDAKQAKRFFVSGFVHGVGFRYFTQGIAERLHLTGYVRNLADGRVEAYAIGTPGQLAKLRAALERGPWAARVREVTEEPAAADPQYASEFSIT
jgi:acylphosphatase